MCVAQLQDGHVEEITRTGARLLGGGLTGVGSADAVAQGVGVHQTALYDMILAGLLFGLLWYLNKRPRREGVLTLTFGLCYGIFRLLEDSLRIDKRFGPFTGSQWTALAVVILSASILLWWRFHPLGGDAGRGDIEPDDQAAPGRVGEEAEPDPLT
jgi:prolipoprotein diacylglyceryltransferase